MSDTGTNQRCGATLGAGCVVVGQDGLRGVIESVETGGEAAVLRLDSGERLRVPVDAFSAQPGDGADARIELRPADVAAARHGVADRPLVVPVLEERLRVGKRAVETGRVRLEKRIETETRDVAMPLFEEEVHVRRVPHDVVIEDPQNPPQPREVDGVLVVPVLEERLVVAKQLVLKEEVHVTRQRTESVHREKVELRREEIATRRLTPDSG